MTHIDDEDRPGHKAVVQALLGIPPTDEQYRLVGEFFHAFSEVEFSLRFLLSEMIKVPRDYFDIVTAPYDTNALCNVIKALAKKALPLAERDTLIAVVSKFQKLNEHRVRIAHGTWSDHEEGLVSRHVSRTSLEPDWHYGRAGELKALVDQAMSLRMELLLASVAALSNMNAT